MLPAPVPYSPVASPPHDDLAVTGLTGQDLTEIAARCTRATPGPWQDGGEGLVLTFGEDRVVVIACRNPHAASRLPASENGTFVAHAREDVPRLLAEVARLREALARIARGEPDEPSEFAQSVIELS